MDTKLRSSKYLNNLIEQDHRSVKQRIAVMLGLKQFRNAVITIAGIELMHRIRKGQFGLRRLAFRAELRPQSGTQCSEPENYTPHRVRAYLYMPICTRTLPSWAGFALPCLSHCGKTERCSVTSLLSAQRSVRSPTSRLRCYRVSPPRR